MTKFLYVVLFGLVIILVEAANTDRFNDLNKANGTFKFLLL